MPHWQINKHMYSYILWNVSPSKFVLSLNLVALNIHARNTIGIQLAVPSYKWCMHRNDLYSRDNSIERYMYILSLISALYSYFLHVWFNHYNGLRQSNVSTFVCFIFVIYTKMSMRWNYVAIYSLRIRSIDWLCIHSS